MTNTPAKTHAGGILMNRPSPERMLGTVPGTVTAEWLMWTMMPNTMRQESDARTSGIANRPPK